MMKILIFTFSFLHIHGQLSNNDLFYFNSKYTQLSNCQNFNYIFNNFRIEVNNYDEITVNCNISTFILRNRQQASSPICLQNENDFRIRLVNEKPTLIQVNQIKLHGIELCSVDALIRNVYHEHPDYRSHWALLINIQNNNNDQEMHHIAISTNDVMTFILFLLRSESNATLSGNRVELIFPNENIFYFNRSSTNVWRIDTGYVRVPKQLEEKVNFQLSKSAFQLFSNETFYIYGTHLSISRLFNITIDDINVRCRHNRILRCSFPILSLNTKDDHKPSLLIRYGNISLLNTLLTLTPRTRLHRIPTYHSLNDIRTFNVELDNKLCANNSLTSLFSYITHISMIDVNNIRIHRTFEKVDMVPIKCQAKAEIGQEIEKTISSISIGDIFSMEVDLIHQWYDYIQCPTEMTRIRFT